MRSIFVVCGVLAAAVANFAACDRDEAKCAVDPDCPTGTLCREGVCGAPSATDPSDAAADTHVDPTPGTTSSSSGTTSSGSTCGDLYAICATPFDCCQGLTCANGTCR